MVDYNNIMYELLNDCKWQNFYNILNEHVRKNASFSHFLKQADDELYNIIRHYDLSYCDIELIVKQIKKEYKLKLNNDAMLGIHTNNSLLVNFD